MSRWILVSSSDSRTDPTKNSHDYNYPSFNVYCDYSGQGVVRTFFIFSFLHFFNKRQSYEAWKYQKFFHSLIHSMTVTSISDKDFEWAHKRTKNISQKHKMKKLLPVHEKLASTDNTKATTCNCFQIPQNNEKTFLLPSIEQKTKKLFPHCYQKPSFLIVMKWLFILSSEFFISDRRLHELDEERLGMEKVR